MYVSEKDFKLLKHVEKLQEILAETEKHEANHGEDNQKTIQKFIDELEKIRAEDENPSSDEAVKTALRLIMDEDSGATEYYAQNPDKLIEDIKNNVRQNIYATSVLNVGDNPIWREINLNTIYFYGKILNSTAPERYQEVVDFIEYAFANPDKIIQEIQEKHSQSKESTNELGLYTANPLAIMFNGKATSALGQARTIGKIDQVRKKLVVGDISIFFKNFKEISKLGVGEQKILRYIIAAFTEKNSHGTQNPQLRQRLFLSLNDYAKVIGANIDTEDRLKNFKKKLKKNLDNLKEDTTFSWTETIRGKDKNYANISFISGYKITKDAIVIEFSLSAAEYLVSLDTMIQYPRSLYAIDDRDYNAFAIGEAMNLHYSQYNNVVRGTEQMLNVMKLLEVTSFPSYEIIKNKRWGWVRNIKDPFENALDHLYQCGFLKDWSYSKAKGIKLTDEEASQITSYEKFVSLYIWYELNDYPVHKERADAIIEAKIKNAEKAKKKHLKKKKE